MLKQKLQTNETDLEIEVDSDFTNHADLENIDGENYTYDSYSR